jgi:Tol biopolymer transport system component
MRPIGRMLFVATVVSLLAFAPPAGATFPGEEGKIAFHSNRDGNFEIYTMGPYGETPTRLTNNAADDVTPAWNPDGTKIAWVSLRDGNYEIYTMNADGSGQTRITNSATDDVNPAWSADGTKIWFATNRDGNYEIYTMNANGTSPTRITNNAANDSHPQVSPDGSKVVFHTNRNSGVFDIYTMNPDGSSQTRLTTALGDDLRPNWSPDGTEIVFDSPRQSPPTVEVWIMNADGSNQQMYTSDSTDNEFAAVESPRSTGLLAWTNTRGDNDIWRSLPGSQTPIMTNSVQDEYPDWQPFNRTYARPRGATPVRIALVPAYKQCASSSPPPRNHRGSITAGSCYAPIPESSYLTVGSPEFNGVGANAQGAVVFTTVASPSSNVTIAVNTEDVRCQALTASCPGGALGDYAGDLRLSTSFRITDKGNGPATTGLSVNGTVTDLPLEFNVPCTTTGSTTVGSTCAVNTSINAVLGATAIVAGQRAIWQFAGILNLYDGGSDGVATTTANNTLFEVGGLFIP